jgi:hypothetical protein
MSAAKVSNAVLRMENPFTKAKKARQMLDIDAG